MSEDKLIASYMLIDQANSKDPNKEEINNVLIGKEVIYGQRMTETLDLFEPNASVALKLAARAQHICRWEIPRDSYPMDRIGYLKWREELKTFHADKASEILKTVGYSEETIMRVRFLIQKKKLKRDEGTQILEDVICLVFLKYYYESFLEKHTDQKIIDILQKTWRKMSEKGHQAALQLSYSDKALDLVKQAIS